MYARNSFERALDEAVTPRVLPSAEELAARAETKRAADEAREQQALAALRARVGNLPRHPVDYAFWSAVQLRTWIAAMQDLPPDPMGRRAVSHE